MTDSEMIKKDELRQRSNVLFRKAIIDRERLKAFRLNLFVQNQRQNSQQQQNHSQFIAPSFARTQQQSAQTRQQTSVPYGAVTQQQNVQPQNARRVASMASVNTMSTTTKTPGKELVTCGKSKRPTLTSKIRRQGSLSSDYMPC